MTVTPIENAPSARKAAAPVLTMNGQALWRAVYNAMLFACTDETLPSINVVRFERTKDGVLELMSTDRYRLFFDAVEHRAGSEDGAFAFSLALADCKQLLTVLKGAGRLGDAVLIVEDDRLRVQVNGSEMALRLYTDGEFPKTRGLLLKEEDAQEVTGLALNPKFLSDLGKLKFASGGHNGNPARFSFYGRNKPVMMRFPDGPTILQMTVRLSEPAAKPEPAKSKPEPAASESKPAAKVA